MFDPNLVQNDSIFKYGGSTTSDTELPFHHALNLIFLLVLLSYAL